MLDILRIGFWSIVGLVCAGGAACALLIFGAVLGKFVMIPFYAWLQ